MKKHLLQIKNNFIYWLLLLSIIISCKQIGSKNKLPKKVLINQNDTVYFKTDNVFDENWELSNRQESDVYRLFSKINDTLFLAKNFTTYGDKILSKGALKNVYGETPLKANYYGDWFYFGDGDIGVYKIGFYEKGKKNKNWYISYEDGIPEVYFYKDDKPIDYNDSIEIYNDRNEKIAFGKGANINGLPKGKWTFNYLDAEIRSERTFINKEEKIIVNFEDFDINTGKFIEKGSFEEEKY